MQSPRSSPSRARDSSGPRRGLPGRIGTGSRTASSATPRMPGSRRRSGHTCTRQLARRLLADATRTPAADDLAGHHLEQACRALRALGRDAERARGLGEEAAALLETAGRRAAARDDVPAAIALLERAAGLLIDDSPRRGEVRRELGRGLGDRRERAEPGYARPRNRGCRRMWAT